MKNLANEFEKYVANVYPDAKPFQVMELKRTFFAGAYIAIQLAEGSDGSAVFKEAYDELILFQEMANRDMAKAMVS